MLSGPLIVDLEGLSLSADEISLLQKPCVGGVILFSRNIGKYNELIALITQIRQVRSDLLICVDQEGGRVQRCREGFTRIPPMQVFDAHYQSNPIEALKRARDCGWLLAAEVIAAGMDFSFTPVLDVDDEFCSVIGDRAFSANPETVLELSSAFIVGAHEAGMKVTGKHFPGHGSVKGDSHLELPVDDRAMDQIHQKDLRTFAEQMQGEARLDAIMPAHILFPQIDSQQPVGFSSLWLQSILREQLGFEGVIFSDDLTMEGAAVAGDYPARARLALEAGCDVILVCNNRKGALEVLNLLEQSPELCALPRVNLQVMRPNKTWNKDELQASERWRETRDWLLTQ
ncbi:MAG: beta-N-acetylhexosaminidase [Candidatus Pelagadaptatus aseana]|uniref:beta-N-acetylhexosaminidase n=1 Tax=Candidatus Pelagadaptatus aseana TaxID=3120508 RepID=UPI0039B2910F